MWERRSRVLFLSSLFTSMLILLQMGMYMAQGLLGRHIVYNVFQHCSSLLKLLGLTWMIYLLDAVVICTLILTIWIIGKQLYLSRSMYRKLFLLHDAELTAHMNRKYLDGGDAILVVSSADSIALTMRFIRPRIVLSTGMLQLLDSDELEALVKHEIFHMKNKDPLKTFIMFMCSSVLWYVPILKWSYKKYKIAREVLADSYAIEATGSSEGLGSALLKLLRKNEAKRYQFTYASFAETSINYRMQHLINPQAEVSFRLPVKRMLISLQMVAVLSAMFMAELL